MACTRWSSGLPASAANVGHREKGVNVACRPSSTPMGRGATWAASATPAAMAVSSAALARSDGVGSPVAVRWLSVRGVDTPSAPARSASAVSRRISAASAGVAVNASDLARTAFNFGGAWCRARQGAC